MSLKVLIMVQMAEFYLRDPYDQSRLSRILDIAQDLKALSLLLNLTQFAFVVELACLASRREYLKLDKWLSDKIREHRVSDVLLRLRHVIAYCFLFDNHFPGWEYCYLLCLVVRVVFLGLLFSIVDIS